MIGQFYFLFIVKPMSLNTLIMIGLFATISLLLMFSFSDAMKNFSNNQILKRISVGVEVAWYSDSFN